MSQRRPRTSFKPLRPQQSTTRHAEAVAKADQLFPYELLVNYLDLLVDHSAGVSIDRYVHPVMLFPFNNEVVLKARTIWLETT